MRKGDPAQAGRMQTQRPYLAYEHSVINEEAQVYQGQLHPPGDILFPSNLPLLFHFACLYIY